MLLLLLLLLLLLSDLLCICRPPSLGAMEEAGLFEARFPTAAHDGPSCEATGTSGSGCYLNHLRILQHSRYDAIGSLLHRGNYLPALSSWIAYADVQLWWRR
jgi:hypothetical protein